ncbi:MULTISPECIES: DUF1289 domain-containing protein [unclassified Pseudoalteromonas]|uniref:DUF1289 domain-containing protein n=1 Tax=unclassified Pseudoalteromonas TaxID=194690 RepID=UPI0030147FF8
MTVSSTTTESPCIRKCCLDDNDICLGCFRTLEQITGWTSFTDKQKRDVLQNCEQKRQQIKLAQSDE